MTEDDLRGVLERCLNDGDATSWEAFTELAQPALASAVIRTLGGWNPARRDQVDDLVQESFLRLCAHNFRALRNFHSDDINSLYAYLRTVASSVTLDHLRSSAARKHGSGHAPVSLSDLVHDPANTHDEAAALERKMLLELVSRCLKSESERDSSIFWLYHRQGLTPKAISAIAHFELGQGGIESIVYRLTAAIRKCIEASGALKRAAAGGVSF